MQNVEYIASKCGNDEKEVKKKSERSEQENLVGSWCSVGRMWIE
jgi:hypothetical protein